MIWQDVTTQQEWEAIDGERPMPLQQCWTYGDVMATLDGTVRRLVLSDKGRILGRVQLVERRYFKYLSVTMAFRGPLWASGVSLELKRQALVLLMEGSAKWQGRFILLMPEDEIELHPVLRSLSTRCVMTGYSTVWLDLRKDSDDLRSALDGKWRNALVGAEAAGLQISIGGSKPQNYEWILAHEEAQRQRVGYMGLPVDVVEKYRQAGGQVVIISALKAKVRVAGCLFLIHEDAATYFIGWNGDDGRKVSAHNLVLWNAMLALKERGVRHLDLGGFNTSTSGAGLARFKLGMGGEIVTLVGSYL